MQSVEREARSMQGMLIKRGDRWMKRWVRRWVSLELDTEVGSASLKYWSERPRSTEDEPRGVMHLSPDTEIGNSRVGGWPTGFMISSEAGRVVWYLAAETAELRRGWIRALVGARTLVQRKVVKADTGTLSVDKRSGEPGSCDSQSGRLGSSSSGQLGCAGVDETRIPSARTTDCRWDGVVCECFVRVDNWPHSLGTPPAASKLGFSGSIERWSWRNCVGVLRRRANQAVLAWHTERQRLLEHNESWGPAVLLEGAQIQQHEGVQWEEQYNARAGSFGLVVLNSRGRELITILFLTNEFLEPLRNATQWHPPSEEVKADLGKAVPVQAPFSTPQVAPVAPKVIGHSDAAGSGHRQRMETRWHVRASAAALDVCVWDTVMIYGAAAAFIIMSVLSVLHT